MKTLINNCSEIIISIFLSGICLTTYGQNLPNVQPAGVRAPANIKIDGKPGEWDKFEAYNKNNNIYYTVANDADYVYLVVQATDWNTIDKITYGGITFIVKSADKKSVVPPVEVTYPVIPMRPGSSMSDKLKKLGTSITETDLAILNKLVIMNDIHVLGLKEFPDPTLSIYNDVGIKAAGLIDMKRAYTIEFAIALKYLQPIIGDSGKLNYSVRLNGMKQTPVEFDPVAKNFITTTNPTLLGFSTPTYFSGTYTLANK
jgi:hypothetical protein